MFWYVDSLAGDASGPWKCRVCGFKNSVLNAVCGGAGAVGCKSKKVCDGPTVPFHTSQ